MASSPSSFATRLLRTRHSPISGLATLILTDRRVSPRCCRCVCKVYNRLRKQDWEHPPGNHRWTLWFICPGCKESHGIDSSWEFNGDFEKPTFNPSYLTWNDPDPRAREGSKFRTGWRCHSFIREGQIQFLGDCTHALAGQTVSIPPWNDRQIMGED